MRILFLVPYPKDGASNRYRVEQYLPYLTRAGIEYSLRPFWSRSAYRSLYKNGHYFRKLFFFLFCFKERRDEQDESSRQKEVASCAAQR